MWSEGQINSRANDFVCLGNLMQMRRLTARVHHKQTAVFKPEIQTIQNAKFKIQNYEEERNF
ncbi:hypothetical protein A4S05_29365 [Nostoc sp. KVJ20]|nr:hypothetical protein A4S05_29365 [Nostoc sp. KVJ20]